MRIKGERCRGRDIKAGKETALGRSGEFRWGEKCFCFSLRSHFPRPPPFPANYRWHLTVAEAAASLKPLLVFPQPCKSAVTALRAVLVSGYWTPAFPHCCDTCKFHLSSDLPNCGHHFWIPVLTVGVKHLQIHLQPPANSPQVTVQSTFPGLLMGISSLLQGYCTLGGEGKWQLSVSYLQTV